MRLSDEAIDRGLRDLPRWHRVEDSIQWSYRFPSFRDAIAFVGWVADLAERADHHPDIDIRFATVRLVLSTHDAGGLTPKDLDLARQVNALVA